MQLNSHMKHPQGEQQLPTGNLKFHALAHQMLELQPYKSLFAHGRGAGAFLRHRGQVNRGHSFPGPSADPAFNELVKSLMLLGAGNGSTSQPTAGSALPHRPSLLHLPCRSTSFFDVKKNWHPRADNNSFLLSLHQFCLTGKYQHALPVPPAGDTPPWEKPNA